MQRALTKTSVGSTSLLMAALFLFSSATASAHFIVPMHLPVENPQFTILLVVRDDFKYERPYAKLYQEYVRVNRAAFFRKNTNDLVSNYPVKVLAEKFQTWIVDFFVAMELLDRKKDASMIQAMLSAEAITDEDSFILITEYGNIGKILAGLRIATTKTKLDLKPLEKRLIKGGSLAGPLSRHPFTYGLIEEPMAHRNLIKPDETLIVTEIATEPVHWVEGSEAELKNFGVLPEYRKLLTPLLFYLGETFKLFRRGGEEIPRDFAWPAESLPFRSFPPFLDLSLEIANEGEAEILNGPRISHYYLECDGVKLLKYYSLLGFREHLSVNNPDIPGSITNIMYMDRDRLKVWLEPMMMRRLRDNRFARVSLGYDHRWTRFFPFKPCESPLMTEPGTP